MRKYLLSLFAIASMLFASSCSQEEVISQSTGDEVKVTFTTELRNDAKSRAVGDDTENINQLIFAVYDENDNFLPALKQEITNFDVIYDENGNDTGKKGATIEVVLVKGQTYSFAFWAQCSNYGDGAYNFNPATGKVTVNYDKCCTNKPAADAFFMGIEDYTVTGTFKKDVTLKRPFAQVNFLTTPNDIEKAKLAGFEPSSSSIRIKNVAKILNVVTGGVDGIEDAEVTFQSAGLVENETTRIANDNTDYRYLATAYFLPTDKAASTTITASMSVKSKVTTKAPIELTAPDIAAQRNYRTNIYGDLLTSNGVFSVEVDPGFDGNHNVEISEFTETESTLNEALSDNTDNNNALTYNVKSSTSDKLGNVEVEIPAGTQATSLTFNFEDLEDNAQITISDEQGSNYDKPVVIEVPEGVSLNQIQVNLPNAHVTLKQGDYTEVIASTSNTTLVVSAGTTIETLQVVKGNVRIEAGATVNAIERDNSNTDAVTCVYFEGELPTTGSSDPKIVYMPADFNKVSDNEYQIKSAAGLKSFRDAVNGGEPFAGKTITLAADIDLNNEEWTPIGSATADHGFMGNFDGNGYTIKNLRITSITPDADGYVYAGLFGVTEGTDTNNENYIKNLTIENVNIDLDGHIVAAAIAYPYYTTLENIKVKGNVTIKGGDYTSGVLAYTRRCVNAKNISIEGNSGSIIEGARVVGGVISDIQMNGGLIANYSNFAASGLTIKATSMVGGISGIISLQALNGATVENVTIECEDDRIGIVSGALGGTSTITNVSHENVKGATLIIGDSYSDGSDVIVNGNVYDLALNWRLKDGNYEIASAKGMFWFANEVNVNKNNFNGKTVKLVADIDLANAAWTPIGQTGATTFNGVFDGQNFTISNLNVNSETQTGEHYSSGLFGWVETHTKECGIIKNVKIDGANVKGHHNCGALVGYITEKYAIVENCHVANATIACTYANGDADGDKAGALIGNATVATTVKNCTAANSTVSGGRDSGQVIGAGKEANVTDCSATNVTVTANGTGTGVNVRNEVIGRLL